MLSQKLCQLLHWGISSYINGRIVEHTGRDTNSHLLKHKIENGHKPLEYQTKLTILEKKEITTKSLTQPYLIKVYVSLLSQEHFQNYCKLYNCKSNMLLQ